MTLKQPPSPICHACAVPGQPAVRHAMGAPCPKAPAQPTREEIAAKRRADEDAAAAERRRAFYEKATGRVSGETAEPAEKPGDVSDAWTRVREQAYAIEAGHAGTLLWIDDRCQRAGMHPLDSWWADTLRAFYASRKLVLTARVGLRGAKSVSICRALVNDALFTLRALDQSVVGVIPIMSADRTEATDRFHTIQAILNACGVGSGKRGDDNMSAPGGIGTTYTSTTLPSGGGVIRTEDSQGHAIEFRIYPARITGAVGYTAVAGFCDEVDLWPVDALGVSGDDVEAATVTEKGRANPGDVVLDRLLERFTTTMDSAHLYIVSASYRGEDSAHHRRIAKGDTSIQMVARLGVRGAAKDEESRRSLAMRIGSEDPRLLAAADPLTTDVGAWVTNPTAPIERCYALSQERIGPMLGRYGGRPDEATSAKGPLADVAIAVDERAFAPWDVVLGCAPPVTGRTWARILVGVAPPGFMGVIADVSDEPGEALEVGLIRGTWHVSVLAVPKGDAARLGAELSAALDGRPHEPVAGVDVHDGSVLRVGPLRTAYERGRLTHAPGLAALESDLRRFTDVTRSPRVEALCAAVARLTACYPWLGAQGDAEPIRGPRSVEAMLIGDPAREMLRRLGARG